VNVKVYAVIVSVLFAASSAALAASLLGGKPGNLDGLDRQVAGDGERYGERQRILEGGLGELRSIAEDAIASVEAARGAVERTGSGLSEVARDLRKAREILGYVTVQVKDLEMELDNCRAGLYRIRDLARGVDAEIREGELEDNSQ
jgi:hypothetical protein